LIAAISLLLFVKEEEVAHTDAGSTPPGPSTNSVSEAPDSYPLLTHSDDTSWLQFSNDGTKVTKQAKCGGLLSSPFPIPFATTVRHGAVRCGAVRRGAARCGAVRCGAVRHPDVVIHFATTRPGSQLCAVTGRDVPALRWTLTGNPAG